MLKEAHLSSLALLIITLQADSRSILSTRLLNTSLTVFTQVRVANLFLVNFKVFPFQAEGRGSSNLEFKVQCTHL